MAASSGLLSAIATGTKGAATLGSAFNSAQAASAQGAYQKQQYDINAQFANLRANAARQRGNAQGMQAFQDAASTAADQRVGFASENIDVNSGAAAAIQAQTAAAGAKNFLTAGNNAWREAFGYQVQATSDQTMGQMAKLAGDNTARSTMLTGGLDALSFGLQSAAKFANLGGADSPTIRRRGAAGSYGMGGWPQGGD